MSWIAFAAVMLTFFVTHSVPVKPSVRAKLVQYFGERGFTALYSSLSLGMLAAVIIAAGRAPFILLWHSQLGVQTRFPLAARETINLIYSIPVLCVG